MNDSSHIDDSNLCLTPREEKFSLPEKLKRSEMDGLDASQWEELCIAASENEHQVNNTLLNNEEFKQEVSKYKSLKLTANKQISYPNKNSLKKSNYKIGLWISVAAATIALFIAIPAILRNSSPDTNVPQVATTSPAPEKVQTPIQTQVDEENKQIANNTTNTNNIATQPKQKAEVKVSTQNSTEEKSIKAGKTIQEVKRESLGLRTLAYTSQAAAVVASITKDTEPQLLTQNQDVVILASSDEIQPIEVEKASFLDRLKEKSIVNVNRLLGESTMVVKEYDSDGKLTLYAVQSNTLNFEKEYTE